MIPHDAGRIGCGPVDDLGSAAIDEKLLGAGQCGFERSVIAQASGAAMQCQETAVKPERIPPVDHRMAFSLGEDVQGVAIAAEDILRLGHFLFECRVVWREAITAFRSFDQEEGLALAGLQAVDHLFGEDNT